MSTYVLMGPPIVQNLSRGTAGVLDLGATVPRSILPLSDLRTNSTYRVSVLPCKVGTSIIGTDLAAAVTGLAFANQPTNDGVEIVSSSTADVGQVVTIYGTTNGTNTVWKGVGTLNGTTGVTVTLADSTAKSDWGEVLGVELSAACAGTVTIREASGNATIITITTGNLSSGVTSVAASLQNVHGLCVRATGSDTTTKKVGVIGTDIGGTEVYDCITLSDTTAVLGKEGFVTVTKLLTGDLESTRTALFEVGNLNYGAGFAVTDLGADDDGDRLVLPGARYLHWCICNSTTPTAGGVDDRLLVKCFG